MTATLVSIAIAPNPVSLIGPASQQLVATGTYDDNSTADLTAAATWTTSSSPIGVVAGLVTGSQFGGAALITATVGDVAGTTSVGCKKTETKLRALMKILLAPMQDLENATQQVINISVETATGATLTMLGDFVKQTRNGETDDEIYRRYVRAKIAANRSRSVGDDILTIIGLVLGDPLASIDVDNTGDAAYEMTIDGAVVDFDVATVVLHFLAIATQQGVRAILRTWSAPEDEMFSFDGYGAIAGTGEGWGSTLDATAGGVMASGRST